MRGDRDGYLTLTRRLDEKILIGNDIEIVVAAIRRDKVRLAIKAPRHVSVHREEVYRAIKREKTLKGGKS